MSCSPSDPLGDEWWQGNLYVLLLQRRQKPKCCQMAFPCSGLSQLCVFLLVLQTIFTGVKAVIIFITSPSCEVWFRYPASLLYELSPAWMLYLRTGPSTKILKPLYLHVHAALTGHLFKRQKRPVTTTHPDWGNIHHRYFVDKLANVFCRINPKYLLHF